MDTITISNLSVHLPNGLGPSAFNLLPPPPCPALISMDIHLQPDIVPSCVEHDAMGGLGVNYSSVSKAVYAALTDAKTTFKRAEDVVKAVARVPLAIGKDVVQSVRVAVELPRAVLMAQSVVYAATFVYEQGGEWSCEIREIRLSCVVGLHPHERQERQRLEVDVSIHGYDIGAWSHRDFTNEVVEYMEKGSSGTLEALADNLAGHLLSTSSCPRSGTGEESRLEVTIRKPSAVPFAVPSITIERTIVGYTSRARSLPVKSAALNGDSSRPSSLQAESESMRTSSSASQRVFIALGSNLGDHVMNIKSAVRMLEDADCRIKGCGRMYESEPMYVEDQARFINSVIEIETQLSPLELLRLLKRTERAVGRTKTYSNGPRVVDLDLLFYGVQIVSIGINGDPDGAGWLECPHPRIAEREFVLRPFADIAPDFVHPSMSVSTSQLLSELRKTTPSQLANIMPFSHPALPLRLVGSPKIMQIFNATPDSFSDGDTSHLSVPLALEQIRNLLDTPVPPAILDIGGMSTRPNSVPCSEEEELNRVVPLISALRSSPDGRLRAIPISIDTYRPNVARAAVKAGASCVNDVRGGREPGMLETMAELDVPVILMHSRGDSTTMMEAEMQDYSTLRGVVAGVRTELGETVAKAQKAGVKAWNIMLDPGLGFAKSQSDNLTLLRNLSQLEFGYPLLVGGSRKGFVGRTTGREKADERGYGDAAITAWCCQAGVGIVRVHEGRGMGEVVKMWEAIKGGDKT